MGDMFQKLRIPALLCVASSVLAGPALAEDGSSGLFGWIHGDWKLVVGATGMVAPDFDGAKDLMFSVSPIISLGKAGPEARFTSRDDNISVSLFDNGAVRAGLNGKILFARDEDDWTRCVDWTRCAGVGNSAASRNSIRPTGCACAARSGRASGRMTAWWPNCAPMRFTMSPRRSAYPAARV